MTSKPLPTALTEGPRCAEVRGVHDGTLGVHDGTLGVHDGTLGVLDAALGVHDGTLKGRGVLRGMEYRGSGGQGGPELACEVNEAGSRESVLRV